MQINSVCVLCNAANTLQWSSQVHQIAGGDVLYGQSRRMISYQQLQTASLTDLQTNPWTDPKPAPQTAHAMGPYHEDHVPDGGHPLSMHELLQDFPS